MGSTHGHNIKINRPARLTSLLKTILNEKIEENHVDQLPYKKPAELKVKNQTILINNQEITEKGKIKYMDK